MLHEPVLQQEILRYLQPTAGGRYVDATVGTGGHAEAVLEMCSPDGRLMEISTIRVLAFFAFEPEDPFTIWIDDIRLE